MPSRLAVRLADGAAIVEEGSMRGKDAALTVGGTADIGARSLDLRVDAWSPAGTKTTEAAPVRVDVKGMFDKVLVDLAHPRTAAPAKK